MSARRIKQKGWNLPLWMFTSCLCTEQNCLIFLLAPLTRLRFCPWYTCTKPITVSSSFPPHRNAHIHRLTYTERCMQTHTSTANSYACIVSLAIFEVFLEAPVPAVRGLDEDLRFHFTLSLPFRTPRNNAVYTITMNWDCWCIKLPFLTYGFRIKATFSKVLLPYWNN